MEKEQNWSYSPYIPGSEYYSLERRSEIREGARKLRRQYLRYKEAEIIYSMSHTCKSLFNYMRGCCEDEANREK